MAGKQKAQAEQQATAQDCIPMESGGVAEHMTENTTPQEEQTPPEE